MTTAKTHGSLSINCIPSTVTEYSANTYIRRKAQLSYFRVICPYLHIVASRAEPLKEEDGEGGDLNGGKGDEQPRRRVKRLYKKKAQSQGQRYQQ
jgi:hypothetical protein